MVSLFQVIYTSAPISYIIFPGCEGRAGMAAITVVPGMDTQSLCSTLHGQFHQSLPPYAIPLFIRLLPEIQKTGPFHFKLVYFLL